MKVNRVQIALASVALLAAAVLAQVLTPHELMASASASFNLDRAIPKKFGAWTVAPGITPVTPTDTEGYVQPGTLSATLYSQEVSRGYTDGNGNIVMLLVAYGPVQNQRLRAHRPETCYTANGFRVSDKFAAELNYSQNATPLKMTRLIAERESRYEPISYWIRIGHDLAIGVFDNQLLRLKYGLRGLIPDGALMRVSTIGLSREASFQLQDRFIRDLLAAVAPQDQKFFTGTP